MHEWKLPAGTLQLGERTLIAAAINLTPDSLADMGRYEDPERACARAVELLEQGADIIELGAESVRQGSARIGEAEELRRLIPVLKRLRGVLNAPVCVETSKSAVAEKALQYGVQIIKDPTALVSDADLAKVVAQHDAGLILQHMRGTPETWTKLGNMKDPAGMVIVELKAAVSRAVRAGVAPGRIIVDPGLGMGKRKEANSEFLRQFDRFSECGTPIQVSPTGKQFHTSPTLEPSLAMSLAAMTAAILRGASIVRVHDVAQVLPAVLTADELLRS
jgi:dihydropteroate synthase